MRVEVEVITKVVRSLTLLRCVRFVVPFGPLIDLPEYGVPDDCFYGPWCTAKINQNHPEGQAYSDLLLWTVGIPETLVSLVESALN